MDRLLGAARSEDRDAAPGEDLGAAHRPKLDRIRNTRARRFRDPVMTRGGGPQRNARWCAGGTRSRLTSVGSSNRARRWAASGSSERAAPRRRSIAIPPGPSEEDPGAAHRPTEGGTEERVSGVGSSERADRAALVGSRSAPRAAPGSSSLGPGAAHRPTEDPGAAHRPTEDPRTPLRRSAIQTKKARAPQGSRECPGSRQNWPTGGPARA